MSLLRRIVVGIGSVALITSTSCGPASTAKNGGSGSTVTVVGVTADGSKIVASVPSSNVATQTPAAKVIEVLNGTKAEPWYVTECEVEQQDGVLLLKSGEGWVRTAKQYGDFKLSFECRNLKPTEYDSGVHFRAELPAGKAHWPKKYQVNLKTGQEGNVGPLSGAVSTGLYKPSEWNRFELTVIGTKAEMQINGKPAWQADGIDMPVGYIGLQSEVTLGGQFEFRKIQIQELPTQ